MSDKVIQVVFSQGIARKSSAMLSCAPYFKSMVSLFQMVPW
jgi:hypothetical protein